MKADLDLDPCGPQRFDPFSVDEWVRVLGSDDDPTHTAADDGVGTGRCASPVTAGLQIDVNRGAFGAEVNLAECVRLGMVFAAALRMTLRQDLTVSDDDTADHRVGPSAPVSTPGEFEGPEHRG
jgi:hypothetical protein